MSSIANIPGLNSVASPLLNSLTSIIPSDFTQSLKDFRALGNALRTGNTGEAQTAFAALQKDLPAGLQSSAAQPFGSNTQANSDFQSLTSALKAGDLPTARKAFASLENDLKSMIAGSTASASSGSHSAFTNTLNSILSQFNITPT